VCLRSHQSRIADPKSGDKMWPWREDGKANRSKRSRKRPLSAAQRWLRSHWTKAHDGPNARRSHWHERAPWPTCSAPAHPRTARCSNRRSLISINGLLRWKIPRPKSQIPNPKRKLQARSRTTTGGWALLSSPFRRLTRDVAAIGAAAPIRELLEREAASDQFAFELRLTSRARRAVFEFMRRLRVAGAVHEQARAAFRRGRPNQPYRFRATDEQPDCLDEAGDQARAVYLSANARATLPSLMPEHSNPEARVPRAAQLATR